VAKAPQFRERAGSSSEPPEKKPRSAFDNIDPKKENELGGNEAAGGF